MPVLVGAGTVLTVEQVAQVAATGAGLAISPNTDPAVIAASAAVGLVSLPDFFTPSEAFAALAAGASRLKLFPAEAATTAVLKAHRAVLPREVPVLVVGGITPQAMDPWRDAGAQGFGLGLALYRAGATQRICAATPNASSPRSGSDATSVQRRALPTPARSIPQTAAAARARHRCVAPSRPARSRPVSRRANRRVARRSALRRPC